ncbi:MAG: hypothetical protein KGH95_07930, partial [Thaumarchaeota archaeon]|nr:hypothetical protein [Nitrososphaerota archaeon]
MASKTAMPGPDDQGLKVVQPQWSAAQHLGAAFFNRPPIIGPIPGPNPYTEIASALEIHALSHMINDVQVRKSIQKSMSGL